MNGIGLPLQNIALNKPRLLPPPVQWGLAKHRTQPRFPKLTLSPANPSGWHQRHWPALAQKLAASRAIVCGRARLRPLVACRLGFWLGCSRPLADTSTHRGRPPPDPSPWLLDHILQHLVSLLQAWSMPIQRRPDLSAKKPQPNLPNPKKNSEV